MSINRNETVEGLAWTLAGFSIRQILDDNNWIAMGFRRRPRRGAIFDWIIGKERLLRETFVARELLLLPLGNLLHAVRQSQRIGVFQLAAARVVDLLLSYSTPKTLRFASEDDFIDYVVDRVDDYFGVSDDAARTFLLRAQKQFGEALPPPWIAGIAKLTVHFAQIPRFRESLIKSLSTAHFDEMWKLSSRDLVALFEHYE